MLPLSRLRTANLQYSGNWHTAKNCILVSKYTSKGMCKPHYGNQDFPPLPYGIQSIVIYSETPIKYVMEVALLLTPLPMWQQHIPLGQYGETNGRCNSAALKWAVIEFLNYNGGTKELAVKNCFLGSGYVYSAGGEPRRVFRLQCCAVLTKVRRQNFDCGSASPKSLDIIFDKTIRLVEEFEKNQNSSVKEFVKNCNSSFVKKSAAITLGIIH